MPHSGGGGSHGGGSHGGSHGSGGSSSRTSHTYFPGARRYRRHYNDGREDEYFYSNTKPRKTSLSTVIMILLFGGVFVGVTGYAGYSSMPRRLNEEYRAPSAYVWDEIDIIDEDSEEELEEILEDMNDTTGICPVIYTMSTQDYTSEYGDLELFAYSKYVDEWDDEQHYLVVFAVPEYQIEGMRDGSIDIPYYEYEIMMGDETDKIISESIEDSFNLDLYERLEDGQTPGRAFIGSFKMLRDKCERVLKSKSFSLSAWLPAIFCGIFFLIPLVLVIKSYIRDKGAEFDEVPLTEEDDRSFTSSYAGSSARYQTASEYFNDNKGVATAIKAIYAVVLIPFVLVGISLIAKGASSLSGGTDPSGIFMLIFGLVWTCITVFIMVGVFSAFKGKKAKNNPLTAEYPKAEMPHAEYPYAQYPQQEYNSTTHDDCKSSHEEDEDSIRKGYE